MMREHVAKGHFLAVARLLSLNAQRFKIANTFFTLRAREFRAHSGADCWAVPLPRECRLFRSDRAMTAFFVDSEMKWRWTFDEVVTQRNLIDTSIFERSRSVFKIFRQSECHLLVSRKNHAFYSRSL